MENMCIIFRRKTAYDKITFLIDSVIIIVSVSPFLFCCIKTVYNYFKKKNGLK